MSSVPIDRAASRAGWRRVRLGDICSKPQYGWTTKATTEGGAVKLLRTTDITPGQIDWSAVPFCTEPPPDLNKYLVREGDILISRAGSVGFSHLVTSVQPSVFASYLIRFKPGPDILPKYLAHFLRSQCYWKQIADNTAGIAVPNVNASKLQEIELPLAPLDEQEKIVAEIDKQFSRLDDAVANLEHVTINLKRYMTAILKAALEGRLVPTEADLARREGRNYETGEQLLQRILASQVEASGKEKRVKPIVEVEFLSPSSLPEGWCWTQLGTIASIKGGITVDRKRKDITSRPIPYLRVANVQRGYLDLNEVKLIDAPAADIEDLRLLPGDVLFNEGGDRDKLGRGWIWEGQLDDCIHQNHVFRARLWSTDCPSKLVSWWGNTFGKQYFQREGKQTTNLASINISKLSGLPVPLPPPAEAKRIVAEVERYLSIVDHLEHMTEDCDGRAVKLRQRILGRMFRAE